MLLWFKLVQNGGKLLKCCSMLILKKNLLNTIDIWINTQLLKTSTCGTHKETMDLTLDSGSTCKCSNFISDFQRAGASTNQVLRSNML